MLNAELEHLVIAKKEEAVTNSTSLLAHPLVSNTKVVFFFSSTFSAPKDMWISEEERV